MKLITIETKIWWTHPRKWLSHQNKESMVVKNWTITVDKDPWCRRRNKEQRVEDQNKKLESKDNIIYITEHTVQKNRKYSVGKNGISNRVLDVGETIEDKVPVKMANIQTKTKQQNKDIVPNKTANYQQEATGNGQRKEKVEEPKDSDSELQGKDGKTYNFSSKFEKIYEQKFKLKREEKKAI